MESVDFIIDVTNGYDTNHVAIQGDDQCIADIEKQKVMMRNFLEKYIVHEISSIVKNKDNKKIKIICKSV